MNRYIQNLKSFLAEQHPSFGFSDANSILEMLHYYYTQDNPIDSALIRCQLKSLDDRIPHLTNKEIDTIFSVTMDLCSEYERQAFLDGVQVGMRLFDELSTLPKKVNSIHV